MNQGVRAAVFRWKTRRMRTRAHSSAQMPNVVAGSYTACAPRSTFGSELPSLGPFL